MALVPGRMSRDDEHSLGINRERGHARPRGEYVDGIDVIEPGWERVQARQASAIGTLAIHRRDTPVGCPDQRLDLRIVETLPPDGLLGARNLVVQYAVCAVGRGVEDGEVANMLASNFAGIFGAIRLDIDIDGKAKVSKTCGHILADRWSALGHVGRRSQGQFPWPAHLV